MSDRVTCVVEDGVADVRLNRPEKLNAIDWPMFAALDDVGESLKANPELRAVVLSGEGRGFCAGFDTSLLHAIAAEGSPDVDERPGNPVVVKPGRRIPVAQHVCWMWRELPVPVIAALHGPAMGGGLQMALAADVRFAAPDLRAALPEVTWGVVPDMGGTLLLSQLVRLDVGLELAVTGRVVGAEEAAAIGLVTRVTASPYDDAHALAATIAARSPDAVRAIKRLMATARTRSEIDQLHAEHQVTAALNGSANQREAAAANRERRRPVFTDPD